MLRHIVCILLVALCTNVRGQVDYSNQHIDSLRKKAIDLLVHHEYAEANKVLSQLLSRKREIDPELVPTVYNNKGIALYGMGNYVEGVEYYKKALDTYKKTGRDTLYAQAMVNLGMAYKEIGSDSLASGMLYRAIDKFQNLGMEKEKAAALTTLGNMYRDARNYKRSEYYLKKALSIREKIGYEKGVAYSYNGLGRLMMDKGDYIAAKRYFFQSLRLKNDLGLEAKSASTLAQLGALYLEMSQCDSARYYINKSIEVRKRLQPDNRLDIALNHMHLGEINLKCGALPESRRYFILAQNDLEALEARRDLLLVYEGLMKTHAQLDEYEKAYDISLKLMDLRSEVLGIDNRKELARRAIEYDVKGYRRKIELKELENAFLAARNSILWTAALILGVLILVIAMLWRQNFVRKKRIEVQNQALVFKNKNIVALHDELAHRTNNFFSLIRGMLLTDQSGDNRELVQQQIARIDAMSEVQQHLIVDSHMPYAEVNLIAYLKELLSQSTILYARDKAISFEADFGNKQEVIVHYGTAARIGIVLNELITNSRKHNATEDTLEIRIRLRVTDDELFLSYRDSGKKERRSDATGKGLVLIKAVLQPLGGKVIIEEAGNYGVAIRVPINKKAGGPMTAR